MWHDGSGNTYSFEEVISLLKAADCRLCLGTDSQVSGQNVIFATAICIPGTGHGGRFFFTRTKLQRSTFRELRTRLQHEVQLSLEVATQLMDCGISDFEIHIDVSPSMTRHGSARATEMLKKYVSAFGIEYKIKPDAWASGAVADRYVR